MRISTIYNIFQIIEEIVSGCVYENNTFLKQKQLLILLNTVVHNI